MRIKVTKAHINKARHVSLVECPVALAFKEAFPQKQIIVAENKIRIGDAYCLLPAEAQAFIYRFDHHKSVKPFEFDISLDAILYNHLQ